MSPSFSDESKPNRTGLIWAIMYCVWAIVYCVLAYTSAYIVRLCIVGLHLPGSWEIFCLVVAITGILSLWAGIFYTLYTCLQDMSVTEGEARASANAQNRIKQLAAASTPPSSTREKAQEGQLDNILRQERGLRGAAGDGATLEALRKELGLRSATGDGATSKASTLQYDRMGVVMGQAAQSLGARLAGMDDALTALENESYLLSGRLPSYGGEQQAENRRLEAARRAEEEEAAIQAEFGTGWGLT